MRTWRFRLLLLALVFILVAAGVALLLVTRPRPSHLLMYRADAGRLHLNDLDTGEDILLENSAPLDPRVRERTSPDGRWITRWTLVTEWYLWRLELEDVSTGSIQLVGEFSACDSDAAWSPDSQTIAISFIIEEPGAEFGVADTWRCEIHFSDVASGTLTRITDNAFFDGASSFSPDGSRLVLTSTEDGFYRLYIMDLATRMRTLLTPDSFGFRPAWSPDGRWIAFMSNHQNFNDEIYVIGADGTGFRQITTSSAFEDYPEWMQ
jgi:Tol biopolymer transport system component